MSKQAQRFIIDVDTGKLVSSFGTISGTTQPVFYIGDNTPVELYLVGQDGAGSALLNKPFPAGAVVRMGVGTVNATPTTGVWQIGYGSDMSGNIPYNATAEELEDALNALPSVIAAGGLVVDKVAAQYRIAWNSNGTRTLFVKGSDTLVPAAAIQQSTLQEGTLTQPEVTILALVVTPISYSNLFSPLDSVTGDYTYNTFKVSGPAYAGGYRVQLSFSQNGVAQTIWTDTIAWGSSSQVLAQYIYTALVNNGWGYVSDTNPTVNSWGVQITELDFNDYKVDFTDPKFTTPVSFITPTVVGIDVSEIIPLSGMKSYLGLNSVEAVAYLGTKESIRAVLEVEVKFSLTPYSSEVHTVLQVPCTICGQVIYTGVYATVPLETPLTQTEGDARYVRRDVDQAFDATTLDQVWENITQQTTVAGTDIAGAIGSANSPSASNPFATAIDVPTFDQTLNTTDAVIFAGVDLGTGILSAGNIATVGTAEIYVGQGGPSLLTLTPTGITFPDASVQSVAFPGYDQALNTTDTVLFAAVNATGNVATSGGWLAVQGVGTDTEYKFEEIKMGGLTILTPSALTLSDGINSVSLDTTTGITFKDATTQDTRVVREQQTNGSGFGTGGFDTVHYPKEIKVIDDTGTAYWVPARLA